MTRPDQQDLEEIKQRAITKSSSFNEQKIAGKTAIEASSTTYAQNSRFGLYENGEWVTPDRFDTLVDKVGALYEVDVPAGGTYIITGKERNPYTPGVDYVSGFSSSAPDTGPPGNYLPEGVTLTQGLGDFRTGQREGIYIEFQPDDVLAGNFRDDARAITRSLEANEWDFNPFEAERFDYNLSRFVLKRIEGNLYGSGSQKMFFKLRNINTGKEEYIQVAEVGDPQNVIANQFNLFNQIKIDNQSADPFTLRFGPLQYFTGQDIDIPSRAKISARRDINVDANVTATVGTVIAVYRKDPDNIEVPVSVTAGAKAESDGEVQIREVHPDYIDFATTDPTNDANWGPPPNLRQRETALQRLNFPPGDATLQNVNGSPRGEQVAAVVYDGQATAGGESPPSVSEQTADLNENNYLVATARHRNTAEDIIRYLLISEEKW